MQTFKSGFHYRWTALCSAGQLENIQPRTTADWKINVQNFFKCPYVFGQPELLMNKVPVADAALGQPR